MIAGWSDEDIEKFDEASLDKQIEVGALGIATLRKQVEAEELRILNLKRLKERKRELNNGSDHRSR